MKEDYLRKILDYPRPTTDLSADLDQLTWSPTIDYVEKEDVYRPVSESSPLFRRLLYIKWYNSTCLGNKSEVTRDDLEVYKRNRHLKGEYVGFDSKYTGVLKIGDKSTFIEDEKRVVKVGVVRRKTIIFESCDGRLEVDLSKKYIQYKGVPVSFVRLKSHKEIFNEFCIEKAPLSLREIYPAIEAISKGNVQRKALCLEFILIKSSLFFGNKSVDCFSLGDSLLFFSLQFEDDSIIPKCRKILEYIQSVLSENMVAPNRVPSYLFLFDTLVFLIKIYQKKDRDRFLVPLNQEENFSPVNLNTIYDNIFQFESPSTTEKIFTIYRNILSYFRTNLHIFIKKEDISRVMNGILSRKRFQRHEVLGILMNVTAIHDLISPRDMKKKEEDDEYYSKKDTLDDLKDEIEMTKDKNLDHIKNYTHSRLRSNLLKEQIEINKNILDHDLLRLIQEIVVLDNPHDILDVYYSLKYIDSKFITDIFCYGVLVRLNRLNISNIKRLLKYREFKGEVVHRLKESRRKYEAQKDLSRKMGVDLDPTYGTVEKKVLLNLSGVRGIRKEKYIPGILERGRCLEGEMYKRYKIFLYEYLKEKKTIENFGMYFK